MMNNFNFGENWYKYIDAIDNDCIDVAKKHLLSIFGEIKDKTFLDIGCGSGLFSLAALKLGAHVTSIDVSIRPALRMRLKHCDYKETENWKIEKQSILDMGISKFDYVYCYGVLHHTGNLSMGLVNTILATGDTLYLAIYNDCDSKSRFWAMIKKTYNKLPKLLQPIFVCLVMIPSDLSFCFKPTLWVRPWLLFAQIRDYCKTWNTHLKSQRGMNKRRDWVDWVGGYPYEPKKPEEIIHCCLENGLKLRWLKTTNGLGNNEFIFEKVKKHEPEIISYSQSQRDDSKRKAYI